MKQYQNQNFNDETNNTLLIDKNTANMENKSNCFCIQGEAHQMQIIQYVCLQDSCKLNRLLCKQCLQESHRRHRVGIIDKLIQPLNRLNMNSGLQTSERDYNYIEEKIHSILQEWQVLLIMCQKNASELKNGIIYQLVTVMETFKNNEIDLAESILKDRDSDILVINDYVQKVNFLNKKNLQDPEAVKSFIDYLTDRAKRSIRKTVSKVDALLQKMQKHLKELDFQKFSQFLEHPEVLKNKMEKKIIKPNEKMDKEIQKKEEDEQKSDQSQQKSVPLKKRNDEEFDQEQTNRAKFITSYASRFTTKKSGFQKIK